MNDMDDDVEDIDLEEKLPIRRVHRPLFLHGLRRPIVCVVIWALIITYIVVVLMIPSSPVADAETSTSNMNGRYIVRNGESIASSFNDNYASKGHEYFDVYTPEIATRYGEVFWKDFGDLQLPPHIVERFRGKVIAITGYEYDQVMVSPAGEPGENPDEDVSVPISWAYNHHYTAFISGSYARIEKATPVPGDMSDHGGPAHWKVVELEAAKFRDDPSIPTNQMFSEGNGGEARKSFHGYPKGYAQLIDSPNKWVVTPMQIDTRNRDCGLTLDTVNCTILGPEPQQAHFGRKHQSRSGLVECPCTSRFGGDPSIYKDTRTKRVEVSIAVQVNQPCQISMSSSAHCFEEIAKLHLETNVESNRTVHEEEFPTGCSIVSDSGRPTAVFNTIGNGVCESGNVLEGSASIHAGDDVVHVRVQVASEIANITLTGPSLRWFAVGFNATRMADQPYALVVTDNGVIERKIGICGDEGRHCPGDVLSPSITVLSTTVQDGMRSVVVQRASKGRDEKYYTFTTAGQTSMSVIAAVGKTLTFEYHQAHGASTLTLWGSTPTAKTCVCELGRVGYLCDNEGNHCTSFTKECIGDLTTQKNPTCSSLTYVGGLNSCCAHQRILLDEDQPDQSGYLRYHQKYRFWFEEYNNHVDLPRYYDQTEAHAGEYDIPPAFRSPGDGPIPGYPDWPEHTLTPGTTCQGSCFDGVAKDCECVHTLTRRWQLEEPTRLIYLGPHCHAPHCVSMTLYRNDSGVLTQVCHTEPIYGQGKDKFDEPGYALLPPCIWGPDEGLQQSFLMPKGQWMLGVIKTKNTFVGHFGQMASWQGRAIDF